jgi:hypothetical protein
MEIATYFGIGGVGSELANGSSRQEAILAVNECNGDVPLVQFSEKTDHM